MPKKIDLNGLSQIYMTLGQLDEAIKMHAEDADAAHPSTGLAMDLEDVSSRLRSSQRVIKRVIDVATQRQKP